MISVIICSKHQELNNELADNIRQTIGTDYEIIHIDNSKGAYGICSAYNEGVRKAKGDILCFMHEDVLFHSQHWGKQVELSLSNEIVGALGVAGSHVVTRDIDWRFFSKWCIFHLIQGSTTIEENSHYFYSLTPSTRNEVPLCQVATLDGVWICIRKELFKEIQFDEQTFPDFHLYDTDICMQVNMTGKGVFLTHEVLLEHKSAGNFNEKFKNSMNSFSKKWEKELPFVCGSPITPEEIAKERHHAENYLKERIREDAVATEVRMLFQQKAKGESVRDYTETEKELIENSSFAYRKRCIKNSQLTNNQVRKLMSEYFQIPFAHRKGNLILKYIWYRWLTRFLHKSYA